MTRKHVLIADDDAELTAALKLRCEQMGLSVATCDNGAEAVSLVSRILPDLVVLDVMMPAGNGVAVCNALASNPHIPLTPTIVLSGRRDEETIRRCEALGAHYVIKSAQTWEHLRPLICRLLDIECGNPESQAASPASASPRPAGTVLMIDDDPDVAKAMQIKLAGLGLKVLQALSGMQGYWMALKERPDAIILDYSMPDGRGDYTLRRLKEHPLTKDIPVIVATGHARGSRTDFGLERDFMRMGAVRFLTKPIDFAALVEELRGHMSLPQAAHPLPSLTPMEWVSLETA